MPQFDGGRDRADSCQAIGHVLGQRAQELNAPAPNSALRKPLWHLAGNFPFLP